jgi:hypothetical protein
MAFAGDMHCGREPPTEDEYYEDLEAYYVMKSVHNK